MVIKFRVLIFREVFWSVGFWVFLVRFFGFSFICLYKMVTRLGFLGWFYSFCGVRFGGGDIS